MAILLRDLTTSEYRNLARSSAGWAVIVSIVSGGITLLLALLAHLLDPSQSSIPIFAEQGRLYCVAAAMLAGAAIVGSARFHPVGSDSHPLLAAAWLLRVGSPTLLFSSFRSTPVIIVMVILTAADGWLVETAASGATSTIGRYLNRPTALLLAWTFLIGTLEFHFRWLLLAPVAAGVGTAAYIRIRYAREPAKSIDWPLVAVTAVLVAEGSIAVSFLNVSTGLSAVLVILVPTSVLVILRGVVKGGWTS